MLTVEWDKCATPSLPAVTLATPLLAPFSSSSCFFNTGCHREKGWDKPHIKPYQNLSLDPASSVFHYALEVRVLHESCVVGAGRGL
jgi:hypothetical protein